MSVSPPLSGCGLGSWLGLQLPPPDPRLSGPATRSLQFSVQLGSGRGSLLFLDPECTLRGGPPNLPRVQYGHPGRESREGGVRARPRAFHPLPAQIISCPYVGTDHFLPLCGFSSSYHRGKPTAGCPGRQGTGAPGRQPPSRSTDGCWRPHEQVRAPGTLPGPC